MAHALVSQSEAQRRLRRDTPIEALSRECSALPFCHIQPGALFKHLMEFPQVCELKRFLLCVIGGRTSCPQVYIATAGMWRGISCDRS